MSVLGCGTCAMTCLLVWVCGRLKHRWQSAVGGQGFKEPFHNDTSLLGEIDMRAWGVCGKGLMGSIVLAMVFLLSSASASLVTFPGGKKVDLSQWQLEQIKAQPGVFFVRYSKERIIPDNITHRAIVEIPDELGGGFLVGLVEDIDGALSAVMSQDPGGRRDQPGALLQEEKARSELSAGFRTAFLLAGDYRSDKFDWSIAGDTSGQNPNILSELTWDNLKIFQLRLANETVIHQVFYARGLVSYGWIYDGDNQDSDYLGDNRTLEFSRSNNNAGDGDTWDWSVGIGPRLTFGLDYLEIMPLLGYAYYEQHLTITDGYQTIPPLGPFEGVDITYDTRWRGPWVGLDLKLRAGRPLGIFRDVGFFTTFEYHWADYYAQADWNLRADFAHPKSFEHEADGHGYIFTIGTQLYFNLHWALIVGYAYSKWETDPGIDRTFFADGTVGETRLNKVNWKSSVFSLGICYRF